MTARKNGRGGGPKKRTQWRPEKNGPSGGPKKRARWRPEKTGAVAARKNGPIGGPKKRKDSPEKRPENRPENQTENLPEKWPENGPKKRDPWSLSFSRFSRFSRGPGNLPEKRETPFFQGPIAPVFGARRWFFQGALSAYVNGFSRMCLKPPWGGGR